MTADLSAKRYYTFSELASRLQCSEQDLRHFVAVGELVPSLFLDGGNYRLFQMQADPFLYDETGDVYPSEVEDGQDHGDGTARQRRVGLHYAVLPRLTGPNHCVFRFASEQSTGHDVGDLLYGLEGPTDIDDMFSGGVVMAEELDRFLASKAKKGQAVMAEKSLATTERNTLLKLVIGMAIKGYKYQPDATRGTVPAEIASDLAELGIPVTDDTVRKWLKEAEKTVLSGPKGRA